MNEKERAYHREYQRNRYAADPDKARAYQREWKNRKYLEDPTYREKVLAKNKIRVAARTEEYKLNTRLRRYNMSMADYTALYNSQSGLCGICTKPFIGLYSRSVHIDHDHAHGKVRGLLCSDCNTSLGKFGDNLEGLMRAVHYLERVK